MDSRNGDAEGAERFQACAGGVCAEPGELWVDIPPAQLAEMAHKAFAGDQAEMQTLAAAVAKEHGWSLTDYRDVIREMKKTQITGDAILPFYKGG